MNIDVLLYPGCDELDAIGPYETLALAAATGAPFDTRLVSLVPSTGITAAHGTVIAPHGTLADSPDLLVVPGGGWIDGAPEGARAEVARGELPRAIATRHATGTKIASVCTGDHCGRRHLRHRPRPVDHRTCPRCASRRCDRRRARTPAQRQGVAITRPRSVGRSRRKPSARRACRRVPPTASAADRKCRSSAAFSNLTLAGVEDPADCLRERTRGSASQPARGDTRLLVITRTEHLAGEASSRHYACPPRDAAPAHSTGRAKVTFGGRLSPAVTLARLARANVTLTSRP